MNDRQLMFTLGLIYDLYAQDDIVERERYFRPGDEFAERRYQDRLQEIVNLEQMTFLQVVELISLVPDWRAAKSVMEKALISQRIAIARTRQHDEALPAA